MHKAGCIFAMHGYKRVIVCASGAEAPRFGAVATRKKGATTKGRATSFVVSFVLAFNRVNIVAVTTILVLHVGEIVPRH